MWSGQVRMMQVCKHGCYYFALATEYFGACTPYYTYLGCLGVRDGSDLPSDVSLIKLLLHVALAKYSVHHSSFLTMFACAYLYALKYGVLLYSERHPSKPCWLATRSGRRTYSWCQLRSRSSQSLREEMMGGPFGPVVSVGVGCSAASIAGASADLPKVGTTSTM